jgi:protein-S-isoprenylcysteine O-methyltransferase Ste14
VIARWRVFLGFVAGALFILMAHPAPAPRLAAGFLVALAGLFLRGWAAGYLEKGKRLAQDGPYSYVRHPLYAGSFLMALGFLIAGTSRSYPIHAVLLAGVFAFLFFWIYPRRIVGEEATLAGIFGAEWAAFTGRNSRFLPTFPPHRRPDADAFSWARYNKNREYQAALGVTAGLVVLVVKLLVK